jgi:hypothetical protein
MSVSKNKDFMLKILQQQTLNKKNLSTDEMSSSNNSHRIKIIMNIPQKNQPAVKFDYMKAALEKYSAKKQNAK